MWTLMMTALLHHCSNPRRDSDDTMPASLLPQARNKSHGGTSIACTFASKKKRGVDHSLFDKDEDDSDSGDEKDNKERDYVPVSSGSQ